MIVNLSAFDQYLSIPPFVEKAAVKVQTFSKVFRLWKKPTKEEVNQILNTDCWDPEGGFDAALLIKDKQDVIDCIGVLANNFEVI